VQRLNHLAAIVLAGLAVSGCTGESQGLGGLQPTGLAAATSSTSAFPDAKAPAAGTATAVNPLADPFVRAPSGRQVIAQPTVADIMKAGPLPEMALGRADAPVTIVQYASLTCPHCKRFHRETFPKLKREYIDTGKVRFILRDFPIGKTSGNATIALRCAKPEKYFKLYGLFLKQQSSWVSQEVRLDAIYAVAKQVGMTRPQFDACLKNQGMIDGLKWIKDRGRTLGIIGTPNFFVAGKRVKSTLSMADIRKMVDPLLKSPATASAGPAAN
jgi:protein-disulfide isomerase